MNASTNEPTDEQVKKLQFLAMNAMKDAPCKKVNLTEQANWNKYPSRWMHRVVNKLIFEGCVDIFKDPEYKRRGPVPLMYKITESGEAKLKALIDSA